MAGKEALFLLIAHLAVVSPALPRATAGAGGIPAAGRSPPANGPERFAVFLRGASTSPRVEKALLDLHRIKNPNSLYLPTRVEGGQLQGNSMVEKTCARTQASMYGYVSHTKKRPDRLALGRLFSGRVLDAFEFRVIASGPPVSASVRLPQVGSMTAFIFLGKFWQSDRYLARLKNFLLDAFGTRHANSLALDRLETVLVGTAHNATHVTLQQYLLTSKEAASNSTCLAAASVPLRDGKMSLGKLDLKESLPSLALEVLEARLGEEERVRDALGMKPKTKTPHSLKQLERKREKKSKAQAKRSHKILAAAEEEGRSKDGISATADLLQERAKVDAEEKKLRGVFFAGISHATEGRKARKRK
jgi:ribosome production factor 2